MEPRDSATVEAFFTACAAGDLVALRDQLGRDRTLASHQHNGSTGLHLAVGHPDAVRLLLEQGADPKARDTGDNALPIHFAAGGGHVESVRLLIDAGSDVHGEGDLHRMDVIGWATVFAEAHRDVVDLLVERGARHHVFSAIALGDTDRLRRLAASDPAALARRLSPFEQEQTALHYVIAPADGLVGGLFRTGSHYRTLDVLIELGADVNARDAKGRTPIEVAMLRGDREAMRRLHAAGAALPRLADGSDQETIASLGGAVERVTPMLAVPDVKATVAWYQSIGFELAGSYVDNGQMNWACVRLGGVELMFVPATEAWRQEASGVSVWIYTNRIDDLYARLKHRQLDRARAALTGEASDAPDVPFVLDLYTAFYGQREFGIRDPNAIHVMFAQPLDPR